MVERSASLGATRNWARVGKRSGHTRSFHPGGANFGFADGSVKFLKYTTAQPVMTALGTRTGGEVFNLD